MVLGGGLQKVGGYSKKFYFMDGKGERPKRDYEDKFPEGLPTLEDVKEALGVVVWCKFFHCIYNQEVQGLQRTSGTILKNPIYEPLAEQEAIWSGICTRDEIAIMLKWTKEKGTYKHRYFYFRFPLLIYL